MPTCTQTPKCTSVQLKPVTSLSGGGGGGGGGGDRLDAVYFVHMCQVSIHRCCMCLACARAKSSICVRVCPTPLSSTANDAEPAS